MRYAAANASHQTSEPNCIQTLSDRNYYFALLMTNRRRSLNLKLLQILGKNYP
ncbi:hypothetical protein [Nostoc sp. CALU 546]|uniref:hypothetical protein n=1 Tax=Nostoc sp. CALU 546 TaxID=1867241 RepID=UPI003B68502C